jgi:Lar family restriction alleviation protein
MNKSDVALKPCPFCGASASVEEVDTGLGHGGVSFSVGCDSKNEAACMGYQSYTIFSTRKEAIAAWNRRAREAYRGSGDTVRAALEEMLAAYDPLEPRDDGRRIAAREQAREALRSLAYSAMEEEHSK